MSSPASGRRWRADELPVPGGALRRVPRPEELGELLGVPFTDEQLAAVTAPPLPGLVVAGAGSGKTTVMAARVVWLVLSGAVRPGQVLGLTFTNKAAGELAERVRVALARGGGHERTGLDELEPPDAADDLEPTVSTYHAYAGRLLVEHGLRLGIEPRSRLVAAATRYQLAGRVARSAPGPFPDLPWTLATVVERLVMLEAEMSEHVLDTAAVAAYQDQLLAVLDAQLCDNTVPRSHREALAGAAGCLRARAHLLSLVDRYRAAKRELELVDFGDQLSAAVALAEQHPEVAAAERDRFRAVILDEYQDTSVAQRRMLTGLFGTGHPVTAVGDPCQAIYGWRGASVANLDSFHRHFPEGPDRPAARLDLRVNQRSGGLLLELANRVAAELMERHRVRTLRPRPGVESEGEVVAALLAGWHEETRWLAGRLAAELEHRGLRPGQAAVLVRRRSDMATLHAALLEAGLPVEVVGLGGLLSVPAVAEIVAVLQVLDDPSANAALLRLLSGPRWRVGRRDLQLLGRRARELARTGTANGSLEEVDRLRESVAAADPTEVASLAEALADPGRMGYSAAARERFELAAAELGQLRHHAGEPLLDLVARVLSATGLDVELTASPEALRAGGAGAVAAFLDHAAAFTDLDGEAALSGFLAFLQAAEEHDRGLESAEATSDGFDADSPGRADAVALMTVHKAKGLEWEVVALPDLTAGVFPSGRPGPRWVGNCWTLPAELRGDWDPDSTHPLPAPSDWTAAGLRDYEAAHRQHHHTEELRLAYVALTRARTLLLASGHWWGPTQKRLRGPSEVLEQVHDFCLEGLGLVDHWEPRPAGPRPELVADAAGLVWPVALEPAALARREQAAHAVLAALDGAVQPDEDPDAARLTDIERARLAVWDQEAVLLLAEARGQRPGRRTVTLPASLTASQLVRLSEDPEGFARRLLRPMPAPPAPAAALGTRFHTWVEQQFGLRPLLDADELPGAQDAASEPAGSAELAELQEAFRRSGWLARRPAAVEAPFELVLGGYVVRGRIDAVYAEPDGGWHVLDWKTGREPSDPLQLAVYRLAWAQLRSVPLDRVRASFLTVRTGELVTPSALPDGPALAALLNADR